MADIKKFDIATTVTDSLIDVFDKMLSMELQLSEDESQAIADDERIVGSVGVAGRVMGCINIEVSSEFSHIMTAAMLDIKPGDVEGKDDVKDVIRDICNIVGGNLKSAFCDVGLVCELSPPCFTIGDNFKIESLNTARHERFVFSYEKHIVIVEVGIRVGEAVEGEDEAIQPVTKLELVDVIKVKEFDVKTPVNNQTVEVFGMMLSMALETSEDDLKSALDGDRLVGAVNFVGPLMGNFSIHVGREFSRQMTAAMLGIEQEEVEGKDDVKDVISELCNIIGGNLKSKFCDSGMVCELSTPTLTAGSNFKIKIKDMVRQDRFSFRYGDTPIVVEVALKVAEQAAAGEPVETKTPSLEDIDALLADEGLTETAQAAVEKDFPGTEDHGGGTDGFDRLDDEAKIDFILDIPLDIVVELGRSRMKINELHKVGPGSVVEFANLAGEPLDIIVNGTLIAKGEVMVQGEKYGIRIVDILSRMERIRSMI